MRSVLGNWPKYVFLHLPLCIIAIDAGVLVYEHLRPDSEKAVRLVRESISRKQGFTVQQLLYATVYHRKRSGESIDIEGWRVERSPESKSSFLVQFSFADAAGRHAAVWNVEIETGSIAPQDEIASNLSWR